MFRHPGEPEFYLVLLAVKLAGYFVLMLRVQSWYGRTRKILHTVGAALVATCIDQAILLSLVALWPLLAGVAPDGSWHPARGLLLLYFLLVCFRYLGWLFVLWAFFRIGFEDIRPEAMH